MAAKRRVKRFVRGRFSPYPLTLPSFSLPLGAPLALSPPPPPRALLLYLTFVSVPPFAMRRYRCGLRFISANESFRDAPAVHPRMGTIWRIRMRQCKSRTQKETFNGGRGKEREREESVGSRRKIRLRKIVHPTVSMKRARKSRHSADDFISKSKVRT